MEYLTTNYKQEVAETLGPEMLLGVARASRRIKKTENGRLQKKLVLGCLIAALIVSLAYLISLMPWSPGRVPMEISSSGAPAAVHREWRISSLFLPELGEQVPLIAVESPQAMEGQLKRFGLWELEGEGASEIPPVVFTHFPAQLRTLDVGARKKIFLHSLLPVALVVMAEVEQERTELQKILAKFSDPETLIFSDEQPYWQAKLTGEEKEFIATVTEKYRTQKAAALLDRINVLPVSLVLAQGAFESYWGTSRFAREGNNLFGMWTWGEEGIVPLRRDPGKTHKLAVYDSILGAVRTFVLTINRLPAYKKLWKIRRRTMNSLAIANGLYHYSERGNAYIADIKTIIRRNRLARFDSFALGDAVNPTPVPATRLASL